MSGGSSGRLQDCGGRSGLPEAVFAQQGVEHAGKPAHDGHHGHLVALAAGGQAPIAGLGVGLPADSGEGHHVEHPPGTGAAVADAASARVLSGVAVEGGQAQQRGRLSAHRQAAVRQAQPRIGPMMSARRERIASAATHSSMRCSQAAMPA